MVTAPWAAAATFHQVVDSGDPLAQLPGVPPGTRPDLAPWLEAVAGANRASIGVHETTLSAGTVEDGEDWPPVMVAIRDTAAQPVEQLARRLAAVQSPGIGLAVVAAATYRARHGGSN